MADPMYRQIADDLRRKIESGELAPGTQLQTEIDLREIYGADARVVSRNTVRDAITLLTSHGLVEKRPGQGTFVTGKAEPYITTLSGHREGGEREAYQSAAVRLHTTVAETKPRVEIHEGAEAPAELTSDQESEVVSRHQLRRINGKPYSMQTSFYPRRFAGQGAELLDKAGEIEGGVINYLQEKLSIKQVGWRDTITVRAARSDEVLVLQPPLQRKRLGDRNPADSL